MSIATPAGPIAHRRAERCGVLLANLGTPAAPTGSAIRRYLAEFLSDRRVVELPRALWLPILYGVILPLRPLRLAHAYQSVWTADGAPLLAISRQQQVALQAKLGAEIPVSLGMRYGEPSIAAAIDELLAQHVRRILVLPLYPQYSGTTTASVYDAVYARLQQERWSPELRLINSYHDAPGYITALADSVRAHWQQHGHGEHLLMSFHSIPLRNLQLGDPYYCYAQKTSRLLAEALQLQPQQWSMSLQSRVGRAKWLSPYTDHVMERLGASGLGTLDVICPGFAADCLETLEEVAIRYDQQFRAAGGKTLRYIPALNASTAHIDFLAALTRQHLQGWPSSAQADATAASDARIAMLERALKQ